MTHLQVELAYESASTVTTASSPTDVERSKSASLGALGWIAIGWLGLVAVMAIAPYVFPVPNLHDRSLDAVLADRFGPQSGHWLGVDTSGYDLLSRVIYGARTSMIVSVGAVGIAAVIGGSLGLIAGYLRGRIDTIISSAFSVMLATPAVVLALALVTVFASSDHVSPARRILVVTIAIGFVSIPVAGRTTRANTLTWSEREFVLAARLMGARHRRIIMREVLPAVAPATMSLALLGIGVAIVAEGGLALLGVGVPATIDTPSWGNLISTMSPQLFLGHPWGVVAPSIAIFLTILSLNHLGDVVRERADGRPSML